MSKIIILRILLLVIRVLGAFIIICGLVSFYYNEHIYKKILYFGIILIFFSIVSLFLKNKRERQELSRRDGFLIVVLTWIIIGFLGAIPFYISLESISFTDSIFESFSGFTATGASIFENIEALPHGLLLWRSIMHWLGGMGVIVLAVAILPLLGIGGMQLFFAESPGPTTDKLKPRIADTAKRLWLLYLSLTVIQSLLLKFFGMGWFDAINHSMSTLSSGGFSTKNNSIAHWNGIPEIQYIIILFMFLAGANFVLTYFVLIKGKFPKLLKNEEFKFYSIIILLLTFFIFINNYLWNNFLSDSFDFSTIESKFRHSLFQVITIITTTGFTTENYLIWPSVSLITIFGLMFLGGCAGSTSGGVKLIRHIIMIKNSLVELKRQLLPNSVVHTRLNHKKVEKQTIFNILAFFILYISIVMIGSIAMAATGLDFITSLGATTSSLANIGPGLGDVGPVENYNSLSDNAKYICCFLMITGRLEIFAVLVLLTPNFWSNRY